MKKKWEMGMEGEPTGENVGKATRYKAEAEAETRHIKAKAKDLGCSLGYKQSPSGVQWSGGEIPRNLREFTRIFFLVTPLVEKPCHKFSFDFHEHRVRACDRCRVDGKLPRRHLPNNFSTNSQADDRLRLMRTDSLDVASTLVGKMF